MDWGPWEELRAPIRPFLQDRRRLHFAPGGTTRDRHVGPPRPRRPRPEAAMSLTEAPGVIRIAHEDGLNRLIDSRCIGHGDCFAKKMSAAGTVRYIVTRPSGVYQPIGATAFTVKVKASSKPAKEGWQHDVRVSRDARGFTVDRPVLEVEQGDSVLWHAPGPRVPGFAVCGEHGRHRFDSFRIDQEAVYTHAFDLPGEYRWVDAHGSGLSGVVVVRSPDKGDRKSHRAWIKALSKGSLVHIRGGRAIPAKIELVTGQTAFWAVESAPGISITDERLLGSKSVS